MSTIVKITQSPFTTSVVKAEGLQINLYVPYSKTSVTIQIGSDISPVSVSTQGDIQIANPVVIVSTPNTKTLSFDINGQKTHTICVKSKSFRIDLLNIGIENIGGQDFYCYEFAVDKI